MFRSNEKLVSRLVEKSILVELGIFDGEIWRDCVLKARYGLRDSSPLFYNSMLLELWLQDAKRFGIVI